MKTIRLTAAQAAIRYIANQLNEDGEPFIAGCWAIFGHGNVAGIGEALHSERERLQTWRGHNEQTMAHTAIAYAKQLGRRRAMMVTSSIGPGATNMVTAAALAHVNRLPVLLMPGDVFAGRGPDPVLQQVEDFDDGTVSANDCFRPVSRYFDRIMRPEQLLTALPRAFRTMTDPADCGPVTLAFCQDVQAEAYDWPEDFFAHKTWRIRRPQPDPVEVRKVADILRTARNPVIIAGGGVHYGQAHADLQAFAERFAIPVVVPISLRMMWTGDRIHFVMGLMMLIFGLAMLATSAQVHRLYRDTEKLRRELYSSIEVEQALEYLVRLDSLTGIPNRRLFEEALDKEWARAKRDPAPVSLIMVDIDHFKEYNDHYGHPAGDLCLVDVAQAMHRALSRPGDVVARVGGEEFAFLLPNTDLSGAIAVAEQVRARILALDLPHDASPVARQVTLSFGVSSSELAAVTSPAELIRTSDIALYEAKHRGRNQIVAAVETAADLDRTGKAAGTENT